jgi:SAM-dependent methyltransferase
MCHVDDEAVGTHAVAMAMHAQSLGLVPPAAPTTAASVRVLAGSHPALATLAAYADAAPARCGHDVSDPPERPDGHRLGDLYQQLSTAARKGRALCQTPRWVANLLLHMTVPDATAEWGAPLRAMDPACGTGHILMETLIRTGSLNAVHGVDLDPYAVLVARYRLLAMACRMNGGTRRLDEAHDLEPRIACADSLLSDSEPLLARGQYHVVIGNPPYITVKDPAVNAAVRARYPQVCSGKYSLALPFCQLMTELTVPGGHVVQLTANSYMKREFGKKFIEEYLPGLDLRWVIDTSGAYIPGHGTPTVILHHRNRPPVGDTVAVIQGVKGEPSIPADPSRGLVWAAIEAGVRDRLSGDRFGRAARAGTPATQTATAGTPPAAPMRAPTPGPRRPPAREAAQPSLLDLLEAG